MGTRPRPTPPSRSGARVSVLLIAIAALAVLASAPSSASSLVRALELAAIVVLGLIVLTSITAVLSTRLAGWREDEAQFEVRVKRAERLGREGLAAQSNEDEFVALDPFEDADFDELVREALDELPDLLRNSLRHVAVVISDRGHRIGAYGLYEGDGSERDHHPDRIVIFRDTLRRDFGHDAAALRGQVIRTVRHELAHHVGFDEMGVRRLGL
jgi:predicted Zn-dependent protease with MMP-like domain